MAKYNNANTINITIQFGKCMKFKSMRRKLTIGTITTISCAFILILLLVTLINIRSTQRSLNQSEEQIRSSIIAKGEMLVINNSIALQNLVEDNAVGAIQQVVSSTVKNSNDIVYGIYINSNLQPMANANDENRDGKVTSFEPLTDSMSLWAGKIVTDSVKETAFKGKDLLEFASAIIIDGEKIGTIRYGISIESMYESLKKAKKQSIQNLYETLFLLFIVGIITMAGSAIASNIQARQITNPVSSLAKSAEEIGKGNYATEIKIESDDEIGVLANTFETMRQMVKRFTTNLQDLVDEKMRQVTDILNNIDQGLFTINLDLSVNPDYSSRANTILGVEDLSKCTLEEILQLNIDGMNMFKKWMNVVIERHAHEKWKKLTKLAPVQEMEIEADGEKKYLRLGYQKILNKSGELVKIMILAQDITESRLIEQQMEVERLQHENEVKTILSIVNNPLETVTDFLKDCTTRMSDLNVKIKEYNIITSLQREKYPDGPVLNITSEMTNELFRHYHTIKGNAGTYGFDLLASLAHQSESLLEYFKEPIYLRRTDTFQSLVDKVNKMNDALGDINKKFKMLSGDQDEVMFKVSDAKMAHIKCLCDKVDDALQVEHVDVSSLVSDLLVECRKIPYISLVLLTRKYKDLVKRTSDRLGKNIQFHLSTPAEEFHPNSFTDIDEAIIHILRNAVDHGIETSMKREHLAKGPGIIEFAYKVDKHFRWLTITDDGGGINTEKLVKKAIASNILTQEKAEKMSHEEMLNLIFVSGLSTAEKITSISGRGVGMDIVTEVIRNLKGTIEVKSESGKGTTVIIKLLNYTNEK
jgi:signal transduction histidine kinase/HPt (histidine-containing phosphotransfer) domain-containing protein